MNIATKCHVQALTEVFELVLLGSVIALLADTGWVFHDIASNGLSIQYVFIAGGLMSATIITLHALQKHHIGNYRRITHELCLAKLSIQRSKGRKERRRP